MMVDSGTKIAALSQDLARLRRRAARQKRSIGMSADAWQRWSTTMEEIGGLTQQLVASPAPDIASLAVKFRSILWLIEANESLLDTGDLRRLRRFGRELYLLTRE
jgi:hypothetical protein